MRRMMESAGAQVVGEAGVFTEGEEGTWREIYALGHLPVFIDR
jgi:hypothetical protein